MTTPTSWIPIPEDSDFTLANLPYGAYIRDDGSHGLGVRIGDHIVDLEHLMKSGLIADLDLPEDIFHQPYLNDFIALGRDCWHALRMRLINLLSEDTSPLRPRADEILLAIDSVQMRLPIQIGDYTDFYSSIEHATNVGKMFRDPDNALLPNWKHLPVGYHGRASSIFISGQNFHRPCGQTKAADAIMPSFGPSRRLDFELEMAFIIGRDSSPGHRISTGEVEDYVFGMVLFNDWSARDIQQWEYVPLGPFLGKNFASTISPWIVTLEALAPYKVAGPIQDPAVLPYLRYEGEHTYNVHLEVGLTPNGGDETILTRSNYRYMYWNIAQQLAHHTVNGCNVRVGDMMASGTISGESPDTYGSMLELSWAGKRPIILQDGSERTFVEDGDRITMRGYAGSGANRVGFGEATAVLLPALIDE